MAPQHSFFQRLYFDLAAEERLPKLIGEDRRWRISDSCVSTSFRTETHTLVGCLQAIPLSAKCAASSPDWNISRTMSQPPMNSPLT